MNEQWPVNKTLSGQTSEDREATTREKVRDDLLRLPPSKDSTGVEQLSLNALLYRVLFGDGVRQRLLSSNHALQNVGCLQ